MGVKMVLHTLFPIFMNLFEVSLRQWKDNWLGKTTRTLGVDTEQRYGTKPL